MKCPNCASPETAVTNSRPTAGYESVKRRRACGCGHRFTTVEIEASPFASADTTLSNGDQGAAIRKSMAFAKLAGNLSAGDLTILMDLARRLGTPSPDAEIAA